MRCGGKHVLFVICVVVACGGAWAAEQAEADKKEIKKEGQTIVSRPSDYKVIKQDWGELAWMVSRELKNSETLTVGKGVIKPGCESPRHSHPNCDEVLHVVKGRILHSMEGGKKVEMSEGDTISIPANIVHNAKNIGKEDALLIMCFSTADRKVVNE